MRVTSGNGIFGGNDGTAFVSAAKGTVTLRGGAGSVGSNSGAIRIHSGSWTAVASRDNIAIESVDENNRDSSDLTIYSIAGTNDVSIKAKNLYAYDGQAVDGYKDDFARLGYIQGQSLLFKVTGDFGKAPSQSGESNALRVGSTSTIYFEPGVQNLWLHAMGSGNLGINDINASGIVDIVGDDAVTVGVNGQLGGIKGNSVTVKTVNALTVHGDIVSNSETLLTSTEGNVTVGGNLTSHSAVDLTAATGAAVNGNIKSETDAVTILVETGDITIGESAEGEDAKGSVIGTRVDLDANAGNIAVNGNIESTSDSGQVMLDAAKAISVVGDIASKGKVALTAGSNAVVDGNITSTDDTVKIVASVGKIAIGENAESSNVSGTSVDLDANGGGITVKGNVQSTGESGQVTLDTNEAILVVGDITSQGNVALTAGSDITIGESVESESAKGNVSGQSVDMIAQSGHISVNGNVDSLTHAKLAALSSISVHGSVSGAGAVELVAGQAKERTQEVGDIFVEGKVESTGNDGHALLSATGDITVNGNVTSVGQTRLAAGNGVAVTGTVGSSKDAVDITAEKKGIRVDGNVRSHLQTALKAGLGAVIDGNVNSATEAVTVLANGGGITIGDQGQGSVSGKSVALDAKGGHIYVNGSVDSTDTAGYAKLTATGDITVKGSVTGKGAVELSATSDINVNGSVTSIGHSSLTAGNGVSVAGKVESFANQVTVIAQNESINVEGDIVSNGEDGEANLSAKKDITVTGSITSAKDVRLDAETGGVTVGTETSGAKITAAENVAITAAKSVTFKGGEISAGAKATVKAGKEGIDFTKLKLKAADAQITSDGNIKLGAADLTVTNKADIVAAGSLGFADSELTAAEAKLQGVDITATKAVVEATKSIELTATGEGGITAEGGQFKVTTTDETGGNILVDSQGSANLANADFTINKGDLKIAAQDSVDLKGVDFVIAEGGMTIEAKSGDMDLSGAKGLDMEEIDLSAGGSMAANDLEVTVSKHLNIAAGQDVKAKNIDIKVKGESGDVTFKAAKGAVDLANAQIDATGDGATVGNVSVTAGTEADLTNVFATKEAFTAENLTVKAGGEVTLGNASQSINATKGSVLIEAANLDGNRLTAGSFIQAADSVSLNLTKAGLTVNDKTDIVAQKNASLVANGDVALEGDILVTGNESVDVKALAGDLDLKGAVTVGDETIAENQANVTLYAKKALTQTTADGDAGVRGKTLTATAGGGDLTLAAIEDEAIGSQGNAFEEMTIESEGNVYLGSNGRDTKVTINQTRGGKVDGELKAYGLHNAFEFINDVSVAGDALIYASAIHGKSFEAGKALQIVTAGFDDEVEDGRQTGVAFTGNLKAQDHVGIFTNTGDIKVDGTTTATQGYIDVYRLATEDEGTVSMDGGRGGYTITVYNGSGDIHVTDVLYGQDTVYTFTGNGNTKGREYLLSAIHKQAAVADAENIGNQIDLEHMKDMTAFDLMPELPHLVFDGLALEYADNDRIDPFVYPAIDTISPSHEYFFLHLRSDAAANKAAKSEDENESKVLERGLPAKGEGLIRDMREPTKTETLTVKEDAQGWIVSRAD
ncbi:MAG: hypothetical protein Q4E62_02815 [Sutterellaceae bacterium]|nr:hypothetical protein [Sutterellaceae bacterium]